MVRIIFVGIHNKPGIAPLDSCTRSGKLIDKTIEWIKEHRELAKKGPFDFKKSNLFDTEFIPENFHRSKVIYDWRKRVSFCEEEDILVLLGHTVQKVFENTHRYGASYIKSKHPSARHNPHKEFIENIVGHLELALLRLPF